MLKYSMHMGRRSSYRRIVTLFCIGLILILMVSGNMTVMASSDSSGWISDSSWNSVYGPTDGSADKKDDDKEDKQEVSSFERLFSGLAASAGYGINSILKYLGLDIDSIVLGRVASGKNVNYFGFELQKGNPYGVVGARTYNSLRSLAYAFLGLELLYLIVENIFLGGTAQRRNEFKGRIFGIAISFIGLRGMPYILNIALFLRDSFLKELAGTNGSVSIFDTFYGVFDKTSSSYDKNSQTLIMGLFCVGASFLGLWFAYCYIGVALSVLVHFFLFPAILCLGKSTNQRLEDWMSEMLSNLATPLIDTLLLGVVGYIATQSADAWSDKIKISIIQLLVALCVIPTRELCKRKLGLRGSGEALGLKGLSNAFLMMHGARSMARQHSDRVARSNEARDLQESADAENELADIEEQENQSRLDDFNDKYGSEDAIREDMPYDSFEDDEIRGEDMDSLSFDEESINDDMGGENFGNQSDLENEMSEDSDILSHEDADIEEDIIGSDADNVYDGMGNESDIESEELQTNSVEAASDTSKTIASASDVQSTLEDRMKRQQDDINNLENQKNEINTAMADENARHNEKMGELSSEEQKLQKSSADAKAQIAACDEQIAEKAAEEAGMRAKIAENKEKIDNAKSNNDLDTMAQLQKENLSLETKAAHSKADQMAIKAGPEYKSAKNTLAKNEQQVRALNNQRSNENNRHAAAMDSYNRQLTDTNSAISVGKQHMEQMRNDIKGMGGTIGVHGAGISSGGVSAPAQGHSSGSSNNVVSFDEMRQQVYQKRANIDNFQKPQYLSNLSHRQRAELYQQKAKAMKREVRAERIGSVVGGTLGVGASMFFGAQGKSIFVSGGSSLGGGLGRNITPENVERTAAKLTHDASSIARSLYNKGQSVKDSVSENGISGSIQNIAAGAGANVGRNVGKSFSNIQRWSDENWDGNWQESVGSDNTYHPVTFEEIPLPTAGSVQGVNTPQNAYTQISPQQYEPVPPVESEASYNPFDNYNLTSGEQGGMNDVTRINHSQTLQELAETHQQLENLREMQHEQYAKFSQEELHKLQQLQRLSAEEMTEQDVDDMKNLLLKK